MNINFNALADVMSIDIDIPNQTVMSEEQSTHWQRLLWGK
jgi:hypothetical protein